jgi:hypothetical protein
MHSIRTLAFSILTLLLLCGTSLAQNPGPQFWRKLGCQPFEPRTRLELLEARQDVVILKGFTRIITTQVQGVRIDAVEMRELGSSSRIKGVVIALREGGERPNENRALIDYEEITPLLNAMDALSQVDETVTKLAGFEGQYRTHGDFEMTVFRQTARGNAVTLFTGICDRATTVISLDDLAKLRAMLAEAKVRLDELR